jgi:hypothetical protein
MAILDLLSAAFASRETNEHHNEMMANCAWAHPMRVHCKTLRTIIFTCKLCIRIILLAQRALLVHADVGQLE